MKDVKKSTGCKDFYMSILELIEEGKNPNQISKELNTTRQRVNYYIASLKMKGLIKNIGYGVWERCKKSTGEDVKKSTAVATHTCNKTFTSLKQDSVRGHAFQFKLQLPRELKNWDKREEIFKQIGFKFKSLKVPANSQSITFNGKKIHLTDKSIIIYEKESFISENAKESQSQAVNHFIKLIKQLERKLQAKFSFGERYRFKVTRQHYSLVKNALAKQYNEEGKKLEIYNDKGLWFLIDNSYNLNESETLHPKTAVEDNQKVQNFFNGLKEQRGYTPAFVVTSIARNSENLGLLMREQVAYAQNIQSHIKSIQQLGAGVETQNKIMSELLQAVKEIRK